MAGRKPVSTPMVTKLAPPANDKPFKDLQLYRSIVRGLRYHTFTSPNISYSVNYACQYKHRPTNFHYQLVRRILRYVAGKTTLAIKLHSNNPLVLNAFSDVDWIGCYLTRRFITGFRTL
ncbi:uncharacterized protein LOC111288953 [Durio zibethinus]|uniref:Uncharacterized protein LOC111288953 n=1 Tax=Durio zibethinus TaxID=66656 RepID=A0A6P5Y6I8_DURZI|nr:uncharacterized protein LOC111288953 [Durio zibethinus]